MQLVLETLNANAFNFIATDLVSGDYKITVEAEIVTDTDSQKGGASARGMVGLGSMVFMTVNNTSIQLVIPDEMRGRVMSVMMMTFGLMPLGAVPAGVAAESVGVRPVVAIAGVLCIAVMLVLFFSLSAFRRMDEEVATGQARQAERSAQGVPGQSRMPAGVSAGSPTSY